MRYWLIWFLVRGLLIACLFAGYLNDRERSINSLLSFLIRAPTHHEGSTLMTSSNSGYLLESPPRSTIKSKVRASRDESWERGTVRSIAPHYVSGSLQLALW